MINRKFKEIIKDGKKIETEYFKLYFKKREDLKIGFIVNKKVGIPVKRNKVKRILREIVRNNFKKGDFLFILKSQIIDKNKIDGIFEKIKNEIDN
ncbi:MAG: ribonuclease P protein component [Candidatus Omnitrophica bacterium]|nr:ribonuclease P protein component [Candidatus Omnitrophota bacterium]